MHLRIQEADFDVSDEYAAMRTRTGGRAGAIVSFTGLVREFAAGSDVKELHLEHYPGMTEKSIEAIMLQACKRWQLLDSLVIHRIGRLIPADQIVLVLVASGHRGDGFAACEFLMDFLKTEAVFWKKEVRSDSEIWIKSTDGDQTRRSQWLKASD